MSTKTNNPLVTVVVPAYNHEKFVLECIESIAQQTFTDYEWIVVDDGSRDRTPEILKENQQKYGYELIIQKNQGVAQTLTHVIRDIAKGKYIAPLASDDAWEKDKLQLQVQYMESHPNCALCYGWFHTMDFDSNITGQCNTKALKGGRIFNDLILLRFDIAPNPLFRKDCLERIGYYKPGIIAEDFYINCRITHDYDVGLIPTFISKYRVAPLHTKRDPLALRLSHEEVINMYKDDPIYEEAFSRHCLRCFVLFSSYKKHKRLAIEYLFKVKFKYLDIRSLIAGFYHFVRWWV